jgi:riboflavin biosynthesis pyrimidine reductase
VERDSDKTRAGALPGPVDRREIYADLDFPRGAETPFRRPHTVINMVATVDGKVVIGGAGTTRLIGGETDHYLMAKIEAQADAVLMGAGLVREDDPGYPNLSDSRLRRREARGLRPCPLWAAVSARGEFMAVPRIFQGPREHCALFTTERITAKARAELEPHTQVFVCGRDQVDPAEMGRLLRSELSVNSMICIGGPTLNASLLEAGAIDEFFLTLSPKLQGGSGLATAVEGTGWEPERLPVMDLQSLYADGSELYLRYKVGPI